MAAAVYEFYVLLHHIRKLPPIYGHVLHLLMYTYQDSFFMEGSGN